MNVKSDKLSEFSNLFQINGSCNGCGICSKVCPVDNINVVNKNKPLYGDNCINCLACVQHCSQGAIRIKNEKGTLRFRNQHITTKEIIDANN